MVIQRNGVTVDTGKHMDSKRDMGKRVEQDRRKAARAGKKQERALWARVAFTGVRG